MAKLKRKQITKQKLEQTQIQSISHYAGIHNIY